jgi:hypothetical protein
VSIDRPGIVTVAAEQVLVEHFTFNGVGSHTAAIEALEWAMGRLKVALLEERIAIASFSRPETRTDVEPPAVDCAPVTREEFNALRDLLLALTDEVCSILIREDEEANDRRYRGLRALAEKVRGA